MHPISCTSVLLVTPFSLVRRCLEIGVACALMGWLRPSKLAGLLSGMLVQQERQRQSRGEGSPVR